MRRLLAIEGRSEQSRSAGNRLFRLAAVFVVESGDGVRNLDPVAELDAHAARLNRQVVKLHFVDQLLRLLDGAGDFGVVDVLAADSTLPDIRVVITIDELEYMLPISEANPGFRGYADFFAYLRGVGQRTRGRVVSVVTAANPLVSETPAAALPRSVGADSS